MKYLKVVYKCADILNDASSKSQNPCDMFPVMFTWMSGFYIGWDNFKNTHLRLKVYTTTSK